MKRLTIVAPLSTHTGFGIDAQERMRGLVDAGYEIVVRPSWKDSEPPEWIRARLSGKDLPEGDAELIIGPPNLLPTPGKRSIYYSAFESSEPAPWAMKMLNRASAVIVPCAWNRDSLLNAGFTKPVRVCHQGIDEKVFHPRPREQRDLFVFGAAGNSARGSAGRKCLERVIEAFSLSFPTDSTVVLIVKDHPGSPLVSFDKRVEIVRETWTQEKLAQWFAGLDVFVAPTRGEGWGRTVHEAMACGVPCIAPVYGGLAEFFDGACGWELTGHEVPATNGWCGNWFEPDFKHLCAAMISARTLPARLGFACAAALVRALNFTWAKVNPHFIETLIELGAIERRAEHL